MVLSVKEAIEEYQAARGVKPDMVVVVSPDDTKARYDAVKRALCIDHAGVSAYRDVLTAFISVPSQVVLIRTLRREKILDSIVGKVLMQMNCKMGGALWAIDNPFYSRARKHIMVGGYDSYFDSSERGKAVGTAVWTMNPELTQFYATYRKHSGATSESSNLRDFTTSAFYFSRHSISIMIMMFRRDARILPP
jgi:aubergine-like protein